MALAAKLSGTPIDVLINNAGVYNDRTGCKAVLVVHELQSVYGSREIRAVVHLPEPDLEPLKQQIGETVQFEGQLVQADGFMRNLYVADARRA